jgi:hypothetical protein
MRTTAARRVPAHFGRVWGAVALQTWLNTWCPCKSGQVSEAAPPCSAPHTPPPSVLMRLCEYVSIARVQGVQSRAPWAPAPPLAGLRHHLLVPHAPASVCRRTSSEAQPQNSNCVRCSRFALAVTVRAAPHMSGYSRLELGNTCCTQPSVQQR